MKNSKNSFLHRLPVSFAIAAIAIPVLAIQLFSQAFYGSIVGSVTDPSNAALHGAQVALTNTGTDERRQTRTDAEGNYQFLNLVPGPYRVNVEHSGFKRATRDQVQVTVASAVRADISLQLGDVSQTVEVAATGALLQTENSNLSQVVETRAVQELPVNGRNLLNLIALVPGVVPQGSTEGNALTGKNVFAAGNYQIGGGVANQSATYFDGVPANAGVGNLTVLVPSPDAVSEFRVQTNSNSAEFGRYAGGVVNIASKSGTNAFHGSAYEFLRNKVLNANNFFANANGTPKPAFTQNQFGATLGGPVKKDKLFFFGAYEGYRQRQGYTYLATVPLPEMYNGDFSGYKNSSGAVIPIYDPLTQCGQYNNPACGPGVVQRTQFPGNIIPPSRINPVAAKVAAFPIFALPNRPGQPFTNNVNYSKNASTGGDNDQYNARFDWTVTQKVRAFGRYSRWSSANTPFIPFNNGIYGGDPFSPESFVTTQAVTGVTYLISPTTIFDIRASYGRWNYVRQQPFTGISLSKKFGFPAYMDEQLPIIHGIANETAVPQFNFAGNYGALAGQPGYNNAKIFSIDNDYVLTPSLTMVKGRHTLKFGADWRDMQNNYYQANGGGTFTFDNLFTSQNALNAGASGNAFASFLLGYGASGNETSFGLPWQSLNYQGYYAQDTFQATSKLTLSLGVRWEIPGVYKERYNRTSSFNPREINPALKGITVNGQPVLGTLDFVNTPQHPQTGNKTEHFNLFAPRLGLAWRLNDKTVVRAGAGIYFLPANLQFNEGPYGNALNAYSNPWLTTINGSVTPLYSLSDPFPTGFIPSLGNILPRAQALLVGAGVSAPLQTTPAPYNEQWNFTVQRQFWGDVAVEAAYAGSHGVHLPRGSWQANALPTQYLSQGTHLNDQVPNPFFGLVATGALSQPTVRQGQLLLPFPEYTSVSESGGYLGNTTYHSLQMKVEKRFAAGGTVLAAYTFSKLIGDVESLTGWLDAGVGSAGSLQDPNNLRAEKSLAGFDSRQRLTIAYAVDLPFGKGKKFFAGVHGFTDKTVSGWSVSGTSTFQGGFPLALTATPNVTGFNLGLRPNVVPGCKKQVSGSAQSRLLNWFNASCFTVPSAYTLGNESRTDPDLRGPGIASYNFSLLKKTALTERFNLEFRSEVFNVFNRVQFGIPNLSVTTAANAQTGQITSQINQPRLIQLALRLVY